MDNLHHGHDMMMRRPSSSHEAALRSVKKPPSKPWRAGNGLAPAPTPPPRVYRVEPREFRDLVQRLTGAPAAAPARQRAAVAPTQPGPVRASGVDAAGQMYAPWRPFPLMAPGAPVHPGLDSHHLI